MNNRIRLSLALLVYLSFSVLGLAEVKETSPNGFILQSEFQIGKSRDEVYKALVEEVGNWWSPSHTFFGDSRNLSIEARANGCFCEKGESGKSARHLSVVYVDPGSGIRMVGGLGPLQAMGVNGALTISLSGEADSTTLMLDYAVGGFISGDVQQWARAVDGVLREQIERLKQYAETGAVQ